MVVVVGVMLVLVGVMMVVSTGDFEEVYYLCNVDDGKLYILKRQLNQSMFEIRVIE